MRALVWVMIFFLLSPIVLLHASEMGERIRAATRILERKQESRRPIPSKILRHAKGVAIFETTRAGIGVGGQGGEGIVVVRQNRHAWSAPSAFDVGGASLGAQLGFSETRYIVVLMTNAAVRHFIFPTDSNWNATASSTIGDDTNTERAATNDIQQGSIIVYKDSNGLFGGATLGGSFIDRRDDINRSIYGRKADIHDILKGRVQPPKSAKRLYRLLDEKK